MNSRTVVQGVQAQGVDEQISYTITTTPWGSSPGSVVVVVKDESNANTDVTTTVMPTNSPTVNGDIITLSPLKSLTQGHQYRVEVKFTCSGNVFECFFQVQAEL